MPTVLLADDSPYFLRILRKFLENSEFEVVGEAHSGKQAVELFDRLRPDIVTIDITMPDISGIEALQSILELEPQAKCLVCSALEQKDTLLRALQLGAVGYLVKPIPHDKLLDALRSINLTGGDAT